MNLVHSLDSVSDVKALNRFLREDLGDFEPKYDCSPPVLLLDEKGEIEHIVDDRWPRKGPLIVPLTDLTEAQIAYKANRMLLLAAQLGTKRKWWGMLGMNDKKDRPYIEPADRILVKVSPEYFGRYIVSSDNRRGLILYNMKAVTWNE